MFSLINRLVFCWQLRKRKTDVTMKYAVVVLLLSCAFFSTVQAQVNEAPEKEGYVANDSREIAIFFIDGLDDEDVVRSVDVAMTMVGQDKIYSYAVNDKLGELTVTYMRSFGIEEVIELLSETGVEHPIEIEKPAPVGKRYALRADGEGLMLIDI